MMMMILCPHNTASTETTLDYLHVNPHTRLISVVQVPRTASQAFLACSASTMCRAMLSSRNTKKFKMARVSSGGGYAAVAGG